MTGSPLSQVLRTLTAFVFLEVPVFAQEAPLLSTSEAQNHEGADVLPEEDDTLGKEPLIPPRAQRMAGQFLGDVDKHSLSLVLSPMRLLILDGKGPKALLGLEIIVEATNLEKATLIRELLPRLHSHLFEKLYSVAPFLWQTGYTPTLHSLRTFVNRQCQTFFGPDVVRDVSVRKAYLRPMRPGLPKL